jgi:hypothetical protein
MICVVRTVYDERESKLTARKRWENVRRCFLLGTVLGNIVADIKSCCLSIAFLGPHSRSFMRICKVACGSLQNSEAPVQWLLTILGSASRRPGHLTWPEDLYQCLPLDCFNATFIKVGYKEDGDHRPPQLPRSQSMLYGMWVTKFAIDAARNHSSL